MEKSMVATATILIIIISIMSASPVSAAGDAQLPPDIQMITPINQIPQNITAFFGKFEGWWVNATHSILIVREIMPTTKQDIYEARVVYSWGSSPSGRLKPGFRETIGKIENGYLILTSKDKPEEIKFSLNRDKDMDAYHMDTQTGSIMARAIFKKLDTAR